MAEGIIVESWVWYTLGVIIILTRFIVRIRTVGFRGFQGDDYMTIVTLVCYSIDAMVITVTHHTGQNVEVTPDMLATFTDHDIAQHSYGSKLELLAWYSYPGVLWSLKFTMLFFYTRLTSGSSRAKTVKYLFWACGAAYAAVVLTVTFGCWPYHLNWQVSPIPPWKCSFRSQNLLVTSALNIVTDVTLFLIPIPLLWSLQIPLTRKLVIMLLLSSGVFVITAAVIRLVYTLSSHPSGASINRWGLRETIVGIAAVNVPIIRPLFITSFWTPGPYVHKASSTSHTNSLGWRGQRLGDSGSNRGQIELGETGVSSFVYRSSSQEIIRDWDRGDKNGVLVQTSYDIQSHDRDDDGSVNKHENGWGTQPSTTLK